MPTSGSKSGLAGNSGERKCQAAGKANSLAPHSPRSERIDGYTIRRHPPRRLAALSLVIEFGGAGAAVTLDL